MVWLESCSLISSLIFVFLWLPRIPPGSPPSTTAPPPLPPPAHIHIHAHTSHAPPPPIHTHAAAPPALFQQRPPAHPAELSPLPTHPSPSPCLQVEQTLPCLTDQHLKGLYGELDMYLKITDEVRRLDRLSELVQEVAEEQPPSSAA